MDLITFIQQNGVALLGSGAALATAGAAYRNSLINSRAQKAAQDQQQTAQAQMVKKDALAELQAVIDAVSKENARIGQRLDESQDENTKLRARLDTLEAAAEEAEGKLRLAEARIAALTQELQAARAQTQRVSDDWQAKYIKLEDEFVAFKQSVEGKPTRGRKPV